MAKYDPKVAQDFINKLWDESMQQSIMDFIRIPNQSKNFDPEWNTNGLQEKACAHIVDWSKKQNVKGLTIETIKDSDKSPLVYMEYPGDRTDFTLLFYGHYDKQPPFTGWSEGLGPYEPVIRDGKMYGRGGADDGYSIYGSIGAIKACQEQGLPIPRVVCLFEGDEESGSTHLPAYIEKLKDRIGNIDLVFCLDSGCMNYDQLWMTTSLRGACLFTLNVEVLTEGVHSGDASGIVPDSFRIARDLLNRIEDSKTGVVAKDFTVNVPSTRYQEAELAVQQVGNSGIDRFPVVKGQSNVEHGKNPFQAYVNNTWLPQLAVIGADGLPPCKSAGNVLRPVTSLRCSMRLPPTLDAQQAAKDVVRILEANPPYGCKVSVTGALGMSGWNAPYMSEQLVKTFSEASQAFFGKPGVQFGMGGSIPLMGLLNSLFPKAEFVISGILGPATNAHGPNEMFVIDYLKKFIPSMGHILANSYHFQKSN
ncbi:hypothetical protein PPERSA_02424 [Pseudocohnilembus persalinus]|uniref:Uncharacterized protein n=1 Tax=Pseudocohnilembus persalinus TaxID=266149 RepID=A0A0V0QAU1_PSEPJ|nr:hypothetical protein PPERSA_02424 [Pseudocohnilembus persalinus]|eukprot:KRW99312.1 hypothetical protein PPERSA_02424 [Pseudocohnilembus persalinus]